MISYVTMFLAAFAAATLLPMYSEVLFGGLLLDGANPLALWFAASTGNTLGSAVNWALARYFLHFQDRRWFPFRGKPLERAQGWFRRYGVWTLLMAWLPIGGDALTFVAGLMRVPFWKFLLLVAIGKGARYAVLIPLVR